MPTEKDILNSLETVVVPGVMRSPVQMNMVKEVNISDGKVDLTLVVAAMIESARDTLAGNIKTITGKLEGVSDVTVTWEDKIPAEINDISNVVAIMSGKGGVGKSLVTGLTAVALRREGYEVGILDADITGPSIPKMFGIESRPTGNDTGIMPVTSRSGIEVMSINLLLQDDSDAVIWRGPLIGRAITQFWEEVVWGKLDYLLVDLPPGTADAPLTVMQTLPVSGVIIVFTPQDLTTMIVKKAVGMAKQMEKHVIGVVENMSYLYVPEIDKKVEIFGSSRGQQMSMETASPLLGQLPIDPQLAALCDTGNIEAYTGEMLNAYGEELKKSLKNIPPLKQ